MWPKAKWIATNNALYVDFISILATYNANSILDTHRATPYMAVYQYLPTIVMALNNTNSILINKVCETFYDLWLCMHVLIGLYIGLCIFYWCSQYTNILSFNKTPLEWNKSASLGSIYD